MHLTIIFNTFVFCQIFNEFNARSIGNEVNVFKGLFKNPVFMTIITFTIASQYFLIEYGGDWVRTVPLSSEQYYQCIILGGLSLTVGGLMRFFPVTENENDYAPMSDIMKRLQSEAPQQAKQQQSASLSLFVWIFLSGLFPALTVKEFGDKWMNRLSNA
jgi:hypothetical protein